MKIAFVWAFYYLRNGWKYEDAIEDMLLGGGDTDTNAAIVGGLLGAAQGVSAIDENQIKTVLNFNLKFHRGKKRPDFLVPNNKLQTMLIKVMENCPDSLSVVWKDKILQDSSSIRDFYK